MSRTCVGPLFPTDMHNPSGKVPASACQTDAKFRLSVPDQFDSKLRRKAVPGEKLSSSRNQTIQRISFVCAMKIKVSTDGQSANTVVSPFSVFTTLVMTSMGARGSTLQQVERTLNISISDSTWQDKMTQLQKDIRVGFS